MDMLDWVHQCALRQIQVFDVEEPPTGEARGEFVRTHMLAALDELHEILSCVRWKTWANDQGELKVDKVVIADEFADALVFIGNIAWALGLTGNDISLALHRTDTKIRERAALAGGYNAR